MALLIVAALPIVSTTACWPVTMLTLPGPEMVVPAAAAPRVAPLTIICASAVPNTTLTMDVPPLRLNSEPELPVPPTVTEPLVRLPLLTVNTLPVAAPLPMVMLDPPRFQVLPTTETVLLLAPAPITLAPVVNSFALLVSSRLAPVAPLVPTIIAAVLVMIPPSSSSRPPLTVAVPVKVLVPVRIWVLAPALTTLIVPTPETMAPLKLVL